MNLLIFIHSLSSGGAERVTATLANHWAEKGWKITIVTLASRELDFYNLHPSVVRYSLCLAGESRNSTSAVTNNMKRVIALRRVLRRVMPDVAIGMMSSANVLLCLATVFLRDIKVVVSERIYPPMLPMGGAWEVLRSWTYPLADRVIIQTNKGLDWLRLHIPKAHGMVVPNYTPYPLQASEPKLSPTDWLRPHRKLLLAAGRLSEQKGFDQLLQAFSKLLPAHPDWDLVILGQGDLADDLDSQVQSLGLAGRVHLPGRAGNIGDWYVYADLYVMSSRFEGFPNSLCEAMTHGCAVVSYDCDTGPSDIIRHEVDGLLVPADDIASLAAALQRVMSDDRLRHQMAERAIEVRERFSPEKITGIWEQLIKELRNGQ